MRTSTNRCLKVHKIRLAERPSIRLCGFGRYHRVTVPRSNGSRYETSFFACSGCSVMFLNDATFNAWHAITAEAEPAVIVTPVRRRQ